jgi:GNAT superfamily N-acetyltransferase
MKTTDLTSFQEAATDAQAVIAAVEGALAERLGEPVEMTVCHRLTEGEIAELFRLQQDAFGADGEAFDRTGLDEVLEDPESLFVLLWRGDHLLGASFAYWEWPDQVTVAGTDFFLDTGMVEAAYRGRGIGRYVLAGMLLLAELLGCHRVGIAAWQGGANRERLVAFYRRLGFLELPDEGSPHVLMWADLNATNLARWRALIGLAPMPSTP